MAVTAAQRRAVQYRDVKDAFRGRAMIDSRTPIATRRRGRAQRLHGISLTLAYCLFTGMSFAVVGGIAVLSLAL